MGRKSNLQSTLIKFRGVMTLYYSNNGNSLRISTGVKTQEEQLYRKEILTKKDKLDNIITTYILKHGVNPPVDEVRRLYLRETRVESTNFLEYFEELYNKKKDDPKIRTSSLKDYRSTINSFKDYESIYGIQLTLEDITKELLDKYTRFLSIKHDSDTVELHTRGELNNNTIRKRFDCVKVLLKDLRDRKVYDYGSDTIKYEVVSHDTIDHEYLTMDEVKQIMDFKTDDKTYQKIRDMFVFQCLTSLRYSDLITLRKDDIKGDFIVKESVKVRPRTNIPVVYKIPLTDTTRMLLERYNYNFNYFTNQFFNRELKNFLKLTELFNQVVVVRRRILNDSVRTRVKTYTRYELISSHTGRRTFINYCFKSHIPTNITMGMTSHTKIDTLMIYSKKYDEEQSLKYGELFKL